MPVLVQPVPRRRPWTALRLESEDGFILLWVLFLAVLLLIALAVAAPRMAISIQRDKELELVHRGQQYQRAIQLYYRKFGTYPTSIDQLLNTDNIRFLRKRYKDPLTGKDDWRIIYLGQAKVPPMGFFGQPLTGLNGPTSIGTPIGSAAGTPVTAGGASSFGSSSFGSSGFDSPGSDSGFANNTASPTGTPGSGTNADDSGASTTDAAGFNSNSGKDAAGFATDKDNDNPMGGGPIVGVGIPSAKVSLIVYKKQAHYNQWEFVYFPIEDQQKAAAAALNGGVQTENGTSNSNDNGFGNLMGNGSGTNTSGSSSGSLGSSSGSFGSGSSNTGSSGSSSSGSDDPFSSPNQ
ncbi:MAG TPA: hypothetical protein VMD58_00820 [Acidobacteriaceae bacterium]|nr:hypothetical protein [Acidobacteriaceae bacterium]